MLEALLDQGTVIVCTSNTPIRQLNRHGVHEDLFSGFQERLLDTLDELELNARQDYRLSFAQAALQQVCAKNVGPNAYLIRSIVTGKSSCTCRMTLSTDTCCFAGREISLAGRMQLPLPTRYSIGQGFRCHLGGNAEGNE